MPVDFLVIGAQKCATSWLYYCLRDHPGLHVPPAKREVEYLGGELHGRRGDDWYRSLVRGGARPGQQVGDVSVEYLADPASPEAVARLAPDVRFVVSLRDPVERAVSACFWYLRKGKVPLEGGLDGCVRRVLDARDGTGEADTWYRDVLTRGFYAEQMERWLTRFPPERFFVLSYESLKRDPEESLRSLYGFLDVDPDFRPPSLGRRPKRNVYLPLLVKAERLAPRSRILSAALNLISQALGRLGLVSAPELDRRLRERLEALYAPHVEETRRVLARLPADQRPARWP